ncbi:MULTISPECIES: maleylacetate reductase [Pseudomonas]|uniref:maleylacetate reductase n=1 Tax=Pseudomonas TaxID=286 RepID=UPI000313FF72|nr:maleylacetate reductase [Pseudomonas tolaasii]NVZ45360.1 maleylacetate reductase [Pseudomonas tolaasii]NWA48660.1 maleylacetate reductase [Pseudomonas tolaasii]
MKKNSNSNYESTLLENFTYATFPQRVLFGAGRLSELRAEIDVLGFTRPLLISTPRQRPLAEMVSVILGAQRVAGIFDRAAMHVPLELVREACALVKRIGADGLITIGGGSTIGLGKAIARELGIPTVAIPTTYSGSEMTAIYGITEAGIKKTGTDPKVLPRTVLYDADLTLELPIDISITSALNAIAHGAEGLYAKNRNPVTNIMAEAGIAALARAIPKFRKNDGNFCSTGEMRVARSDALYGAWLCGGVLGSVTMALHHKLCHTLGGSFNLPHAEVHSVILPHALAYNAEAAPEAMEIIARAIGTESAPAGIYDLASKNGAPTSLRDIGMHESNLSLACELVLSNQYPNPRRLEAEPIHRLLRDAFEGNAPSPTT